MLSYLLNDFRQYKSAPELSLTMTAKQSFPSCHFLSQQNVPASDTEPHWSEHSTLTLEQAVSRFLPVLTFSSRVWEKTLVQPGLSMSFLPYLFSISFSIEQKLCPTRSLTPQLLPALSIASLVFCRADDWAMALYIQGGQLSITELYFLPCNTDWVFLILDLKYKEKMTKWVKLTGTDLVSVVPRFWISYKMFPCELLFS